MRIIVLLFASLIFCNSILADDEILKNQHKSDELGSSYLKKIENFATDSTCKFSALDIYKHQHVSAGNATPIVFDGIKNAATHAGRFENNIVYRVPCNGHYVISVNYVKSSGGDVGGTADDVRVSIVVDRKKVADAWSPETASKRMPGFGFTVIRLKKNQAISFAVESDSGRKRLLDKIHASIYAVGK